MSSKRLVEAVRALSVDDKVEAEAKDAFRELWDRVVDQGGGMVTRAMVKEAIETRLRDYLGPGVFLPNVVVELNATRTGFDIEITPAKVGRG